MKLTDEDWDRIGAVLAAESNSFAGLARLAGLDPKRHFQKAFLQRVDFGQVDVTGCDFSGADLRGADLSRTTGYAEAVWTGANLKDARLPPRWDAARATAARPDQEQVVEPAAAARLGPGASRAGTENFDSFFTAPPWASAVGSDQYGRYADLTVRMPRKRPVTQRLRWIPPGRFLRGSTPETDPDHVPSEAPRLEVDVADGFWLFDTPCTQALWRAVMGHNPSRFQSPTRPVEQVSFHDIQQFLDRLNAAIPGLDLVLPSEAQWEYACRAGSIHPTYAADLTHPDGTPLSLDDIAWHRGNSGDGFELANGYDENGVRKGTHPVAQLAPNRWGLYDMLGNVYEWCLDHFAGYDGAPRDGSARDDDGAAAYRVLRGGSWDYGARYVRSAYRHAPGPAFRNDDFGFRCARVQRVSKAGAPAEGGRSQPEGAERRAATTSPQRSAGGSSSKPPRRRITT